MTSELNLTDEGELQDEEKPRLVIGDNIPPSLHHGHKLDMEDRDPIRMNDHVKVKYKLNLFGKDLLSRWHHACVFSLHTTSFGLCEFGSIGGDATTLIPLPMPYFHWDRILNSFSFPETSKVYFQCSSYERYWLTS